MSEALLVQLTSVRNTLRIDNADHNQQHHVGDLIFHVHANSDLNELVRLAELPASQRPHIIGPCKISGDAASQTHKGND